MLFSFIIFVFLLNYSLLFAIDLNIYKSITEIRQIQYGIGTYQYLFKNNEYENIIDGSISWHGTPFIKQDLYNTIDTLKDTLVTIRQSTICECNIIYAKIIDPNTMLLKNIDTGNYFYADSRSIEYISKRPSDGGVTLVFEFKNKKTKFNGTLSYLIRGITWLPNYDLFITDEGTCHLRAYVVIRNNLNQEYIVDNTNLYSGDLQLVNTYSSSTVVVRAAPEAKSSVNDNTNSKSIQVSGEEKGFYSYSLKNEYTLRSTSSIRLPFIPINLICRFYYKTTIDINSGQYKGVFQRNYDLTPDQFLPSGILTIRNNQILLGQSNLPDVSQNYTQTITLGQDNDIQYSIQGNMTASNPDKSKMTWQTYILDVTISNYKSKDVKGELDFYGAIQIIINETTCDSVKVNGNMISLLFELKSNDHYQCQFNVTLQWE